MKDTAYTEDAQEPLRVRFLRIERPRALNIEVIVGTPDDHDDLVRYDLASRRFIRDLVSGRIVIFWELLRPRGTCLLLRDQENHSDIEDLARNEVRFITDELMRLRANFSRARA